MIATVHTVNVDRQGRSYGHDTGLVKPIIGPESGTPEWHEFRASGFGASEAAAVCGMSPWDTPLSIYARKTGQIPPIEDNAAMRLGRKLEPVVLSEFCDATGRELRWAPCPAMRHPEHEFVLATPDAILIGEELLEAKTTTYRTGLSADDEGTDNIPNSWLFQAMQQMGVTGIETCHVAALIDGRTLRCFLVTFNPDMFSLMVSAQRELWERIQNQDPPEPDWEHARTPELIREMYGVSEAKTIVLPADFAAIAAEEEALALVEKNAKAERETMRARLLHAMGDAQRAAIEGTDIEYSRSEVKEAVVESYLRKAYVVLRRVKSTKKKGRS